MLYVTTRGNKDAYTAYRALHEDLAPDGGRFLPFRFPSFSKEEITAFGEKSFGEAVAQLLNMFFSCQLTGWDVDFCVGRNAVRLFAMNHKIIISELWHNPAANYSYIVDSLFRKITNNTGRCAPTDWVRIAVGIAVLFGVYSEMLRQKMTAPDQVVDISVPVDDFVAPIAAWYARCMGLPLGVIICTCDENSPVWDLLHRGTFTTAAADIATQLGVERLISALFGVLEANRYSEVCRDGRIYTVNEDNQNVLRNNFFCAVAGTKRAETTINSIFRSNTYIIDPFTALCHGGLQDYRSRTGGNRTTLLLAEKTPLDYASQISDATGIPGAKLTEYVKMS